MRHIEQHMEQQYLGRLSREGSSLVSNHPRHMHNTNYYVVTSFLHMRTTDPIFTNMQSSGKNMQSFALYRITPR